ncbi:hypothetical protein [Geothrix fuzhouensis]|uniref:hypothetical protein n=1 Tax=Geothrix fuzhouensis TaxID=2966451 RepID=UPI002147953E|nr:hypothetical protein [Geothrix fuzhouensis]
MFRAPALRPVLVSALLGAVVGSAQAPPAAPPKGPLVLPTPAAGTVSLDATLQARRTTRDLTGPALSMAEAA